MSLICFSDESVAVSCTPGDTCSMLDGTCDSKFAGLEVLVAERVLEYARGLWDGGEVAYRCMENVAEMLADASSPNGTCSGYVGSLHPLMGGIKYFTYSIPYFVGDLFYVFDRDEMKVESTGFEFVYPFSWQLWVAILIMVIVVPVASTIIEKDPGETWYDNYLMYHSDAWHAASGVDTLERSEDVNFLSVCLSIVVAVAARVLTAVYAANVASYLIIRAGLASSGGGFSDIYTAPYFVDYLEASPGGVHAKPAMLGREAPPESLGSIALVVDELRLKKFRNCMNSYAPLFETAVPYSFAFPTDRTPLEKISVINRACATVASQTSMSMFSVPDHPSVGMCGTAVDEIGVGSTKYVFLIYMCSCVAIALSSYIAPVSAWAYGKASNLFSRRAA